MGAERGFAVITAVLVGLGHRSVGYASYADEHPDELDIVAVAEPDPVRRERYAKRFGVDESNCFENAEDLAAAGKLADVAIKERWMKFTSRQRSLCLKLGMMCC